MMTRFATIAQSYGMPEWWAEAVAVEYLDCRVFATADKLWNFSFDRIIDGALHQALTNEKIVIHGTILHNVNHDSLKARVIGRLVSAVPVGLVSGGNEEDIVPEGLVSDNHLVFLGNPINVSDPKTNFSSYFQVFESGKLWQWKIAEFVNVEDRPYGKWVSNEIDLECLDLVHPRLSELLNNPIRPGCPGHDEFTQRVTEFYSWLEALRSPLRKQLYAIHSRKRGSYKDRGKTVSYNPPPLSQFEDFIVKDGQIYTRFHAEPIFYRALVTHARQASQLSCNSERGVKLDEVYQERVQAVICGAACLESFINSFGSEHVSSWEFYESLTPEGKWHLCLMVHGKTAIFDSGREPYQSFGKIIELRNRWLHYKKPLGRARVQTTKTVSWIEAEMDAVFIERLPKMVASLIEEFCEAIGDVSPGWLKPGPGWDL